MTQGKPEPSDGSLRGPHSLLPPPEGVHRASGAHQGLKLEVKGTRPPLTSPLCPSPRPRPTCCGVLSTPRGGGAGITPETTKYLDSPPWDQARGMPWEPWTRLVYSLGVGKNKTDSQPLRLRSQHPAFVKMLL